MRVIESRYSSPANASSGWYVQIAGTRDEVMSDEAKRLAQEEASKNGYDPTRPDRGNFPSKRDGEYTITYWFYYPKQKGEDYGEFGGFQ